MKLLGYLLGSYLSVVILSSLTFASDSLDKANLLSSEITLQLANGDKVVANRISCMDLGGGNFSWTGELTGV
jgi:hypothetical protein